MIRHLFNTSQLHAGIVLLCLLAGIMLLPQSRLIERTDLMLYDLSLPFYAGSMSEEIVVVSIDDKSIDQLGRWPWSRHIQANLIDRLTRMQAAAVGIDILFPEPQYSDPSADVALAQAIRNNGKVVLTVAPVMQGDGLIAELLPLPELAVSAAAIGHVDTELDQDGLCRRVFLYSGLNRPHWPALALAMLEVGGQATNIKIEPRTTSAGTGEYWSRTGHMLIPYAARNTAPQTLSAVDLLQGLVPEALIRGKYVLIGATATGIGDALATPRAADHQRMPGVILNAHILNALLQHKAIQPLHDNLQILLNTALIIIGLTLVTCFPTRISFISITGLSIGILGMTLVLLQFCMLWFPPTTVITLLVMIWPLWTLRQITLDNHLRQRLIAQLDHLSRHHKASGLPDNALLEQELQRQIEKADRHQQVLGLMVVHFEWPGSASSTLGRPIADTMLSALAERVCTASPDNSFIAHLNGDDFAIVVTDIDDSQAITKTAQNLLQSLQKLLQVAGNCMLLSPQIGVSVWPGNSRDETELLRNAYTAMFKSRIDDSEHLCIYSEDLGRQLEIRSELEKALVQAIEKEEFEVYYQPQIAAGSGQVVGVEALLRWHSPQLGWVSPEVFIPIAEHVGLIRVIGYWVLEKACQQIQQWRDEGLPPVRLAVNVSPLQFTDPDLETGIARIISNIGIDPEHIELEITEGSLMWDMENAVEVMRRIKHNGLDLAIDDFGTGYSSLSNLRHFPLDRLKIDRSFTCEIGQNTDTTEITLTIMAMAKRLGLRIIAEGVETTEQVSFLREHGCDEFQGFLYSRPLPAEQLAELLRQSPVQQPGYAE
ncbi:MAG: EAL domain-containing protein [Amphritea sp.]|nr:EAL domain-containing protein [Amphritea sp.]